MGLTDLSIRRPVTITMVMIALTLLGVIALSMLPTALFPNLSLPVASVQTSWPGAAPAQVQQQITQPLEQVLQGLPGVAQITATSSSGQSSVIVEFGFNENLDNEVNQMRSLVSREQRQLPTTASTPIVNQFNPSDFPIMTISIYGNLPLGTLTTVAQNIVEPPVEEANGVGQVTVAGALTPEVNVFVNPDKLALYHLSMSQITSSLAAANLSGSVGQINRGSQLIPLFLNGQSATPSQLLSIPIVGGPSGLTLGDVASTEMGYAQPTTLSQYNGQSSVNMTVVQASGANTVQVAANVQQALNRVNHGLPSGVHIAVLNSQATIINQTISTVVVHALLGFFFGVLIILCILRSVRTTVVIAVAIPIAFMATFLLLYAAGLTLNTITLGSLVVGLGSLVDFSVVVLESIFRARRRGLDPQTAAQVGAREVGLAVVTAALAQVCVFLPAIATPGIGGQFFGPAGLTVSFSHIAALFVAITLTPMMASRLLKGKHFEGEESIPGRNAPFRWWAPFDWFGAGMAALTEFYRNVLRWGLGHRITVITLSALMVVGTVFLIPLIGFEIIAPLSNGELSISATLPLGTSLNTTEAFTNQLVKLARAHLPGVETITTEIGGNGRRGSTNSTSITATLKNVDSHQLALLAHQFSRYVSNYPGDQIEVTPGSASFGTPGQLSVTISGPDTHTLSVLSDQVAALLSKTPGLEYVNNALAAGTPQYSLDLNPAELVANGLTANQVLTSLGAELQGFQAATFYQGENTYPIVVSLPTAFAENIQNLDQLTVTNSHGQAIPILQLGSLTLSQAPTVITSTNGVQSTSVTAEAFGTSTGQAQQLVASELHTLKVPAGYRVGFFAARGLSLGSTFSSLGYGLILSIILVFMVMASLFESVLTPFVIMFSLPSTFVGAAWGLYLTHRTLNVDSLIGLVMLIGLVTNNSIVLVDYTNQVRARGHSLRDALLEAGPIRLRPILMTTLTTVLAMLPLTIGGGTGASALASMATVISFGLMLSMLVSLVLVPVMYVTLDRRESKARRQAASTIPTTPTISG